MRGVLPLAVELSTFGSPGGLPTSNFSKCWASPPHLAKVGLRHEETTKEEFVTNAVQVEMQRRHFYTTRHVVRAANALVSGTRVELFPNPSSTWNKG
jgi:hypothetical protein